MAKFETKSDNKKRGTRAHDWHAGSGEAHEQRYRGKKKGSRGWYGETDRHRKAGLKGWEKRNRR